jgi:hypothetical protein
MPTPRSAATAPDADAETHGLNLFARGTKVELARLLGVHRCTVGRDLLCDRKS